MEDVMKTFSIVLAIVLASAGFSFASDPSNHEAPYVVYPNGGEVLTVGIPVNIQWMSPGIGAAITRILLSTDGGYHYSVLAEFKSNDKAPVMQSWKWKDPTPAGTAMKIKVSYAAGFMPSLIEDESDRTFSILSHDLQPVAGLSVITPNGGEKFVRGKPIFIRWKLFNVIPETIEIYLSTDGGGSYPILLAKLDGQYKKPGWYWHNEKMVGKGMRILVVGYTKFGKFMDESNKSFVIVSRMTPILSNYPNPFNPTTSISFDLAEAGDVTLIVYNMLGREVATLVKGHLEAGTHNVPFNAFGLPSGNYFYRLTSAGETVTQTMQLLK
jgi:hypothetical protein